MVDTVGQVALGVGIFMALPAGLIGFAWVGSRITCWLVDTLLVAKDAEEDPEALPWALPPNWLDPDIRRN